MTHAAKGACYPDQARHVTVTVTENVRLAFDTYRVRFECPEIAARIVPGQFLMLRLSHNDDPLLGRPLAMYDTVLDDAGRPIGIDVVYLVLGKMTARLARFVPGQQLDVWGPLGNGFAPPESGRLVLNAGGIGQTPFLAVAKALRRGKSYGLPGNPWFSPPQVDEVVLLYGARTAKYLAGIDDFRAAGAEVRIATDDGSAGRKGYVTALLADILAEPDAAANVRVFCCGPEPMMEAVAELTAKHGVRCDLSLETPMACGLGICFSCVARIRTADGGWDYARTCIEGPVFDAKDVVFHDGP